MTFHTELRQGVAFSPPEIVKSILTSTTLEIHLSDGQIISYPRNPIDIGTFKSSLREAQDGRFIYEYTLDNRQVEMIRVGDFDHQFGRPDMLCPEGWYGASCGWNPVSWKEPSPARIEAAKYSIVSNYLPGPLRLHIEGKDEIREDFELPFKGTKIWERSLMQQICLQIRYYGNSVNPLVIGPVLKPLPSEKEVRKQIHRWIHEEGLQFLRPFDDETCNLLEREKAVSPATEFEFEVLECVKLAIRQMIGDDPRFSIIR